MTRLHHPLLLAEFLQLLAHLLYVPLFLTLPGGRVKVPKAVRDDASELMRCWAVKTLSSGVRALDGCDNATPSPLPDRWCAFVVTVAQGLRVVVVVVIDVRLVRADLAQPLTGWQQTIFQQLDQKVSELMALLISVLWSCLAAMLEAVVDEIPLEHSRHSKAKGSEKWGRTA